MHEVEEAADGQVQLILVKLPFLCQKLSCMLTLMNVAMESVSEDEGFLHCT